MTVLWQHDHRLGTTIASSGGTATLPDTDTELEVDLDSPVQCLGGTLDDMCPNPATWLVRWSCTCAETYCLNHKDLILRCVANFTVMICLHHSKPCRPLAVIPL